MGSRRFPLRHPVRNLPNARADVTRWMEREALRRNVDQRRPRARQPQRPRHGTLRARGRSAAQAAGPSRPPRITDAELIALAGAQMFMGIPNDRQFLVFARWRLGHLFRYLPK